MKYLLFTILLNSKVVLAQEIKNIKTTSQFPSELKLIFASYQLEPLSEIQYQTLTKHTYNLDSLSKNISKEELYFVIKSEIYKSILKFPQPTKSDFDLDSVQVLRKATKVAKDPFIRWLLLSMISDANNVLSGKTYHDYLAQKNVGKLLTNETKILAKKIQLLAKLFNKISPESPDNLRIELIPFFDECLNNIEAALFVLASESNFEKLFPIGSSGDKLKYFTLSKIEEVKAKAPKSKSVEDIIDETSMTLDDETNLNLPSPSKEDWLKEDAPGIDIKKLPKPTNDADWLEDI